MRIDIPPYPTTPIKTARDMVFIFGLMKNENETYPLDKKGILNVSLICAKYCKICSERGNSFYPESFWQEVIKHLEQQAL